MGDKQWISTKYDRGSIMIGWGGHGHGLQLTDLTLWEEIKAILGWGIQTQITWQPSEYDLATIALLYPSDRLNQRPSNGATWAEYYCGLLQIPSIVPDIQRYVKGSKWQEARDVFLASFFNEDGTLQNSKTSTRSDMLPDLPRRADALQPEAGGPEADAAYKDGSGAFGPSRDASAPVPQADDDPQTRATSETFADTLYDKLNSLFQPSGSQYLPLQLPARYLDNDAYSYCRRSI